MGSSRDGDNNYISHAAHDTGDEQLEDGGTLHDGSSEFDGEEEAMPAAESVEQYVRLHEHIERLRADRAPLQPDAITLDEAQAYQMAAFFRAAAPDAAEPDATFVTSLRKQLMQEPPQVQHGDASTAPQPLAGTEHPVGRRQSEVTRRGLLGVGIGAAAAFIGAAAGAAVERELEGRGASTAPAPSVSIVPDGRGTWVAVAVVSELPVGSVRRFVTDSLVGFVRHTAEGFSALSGTCTHMGCLLQWNGGERTFDCPCHGGRFTEDGSSAASSPVVYRPLPAVATKVEDGRVWIYAAQPAVAPTGTSAIPPYSGGTNSNAATGNSTKPGSVDDWSH